MNASSTNAPWKYLDKKKATIEALKDYPMQKKILNMAQTELADIRADMSGIHGIVCSDMPRSPHNPSARENHMLQAIDQMDVIRERHRLAVEYMRWFSPAWEALSSDDQFVLETVYMRPETTLDGSLLVIQHKYSIERTSAYKRSQRAVYRLSVLLYGA